MHDRINQFIGSVVLMNDSPAILGRFSAGPGAAESITLGPGLSIVGGVLTLTAGGALGPIYLNAAPVNDTYRLETAFAGANNDLLFTWNGTGTVPSIVFTLTLNGTPSPGGVTYNAGLRLLTISIANNGTVATGTASSILAALSGPLFGTGITAALAPGNDGSGIPTAMPITTMALGGGTPAELLQTAISTVNGLKYTFRAIGVNPMVWEASTPGLLYDPAPVTGVPRWRMEVFTGTGDDHTTGYADLGSTVPN